MEGEGAFVGSGDARPGQGSGVGGVQSGREPRPRRPLLSAAPWRSSSGFCSTGRVWLSLVGLVQPLSCSPIREVGIQNHCPVLETEG